MINIEESFNRTSAPKNDRPIKLQLQFKGADGIRVFGQKLDFFYKTLKQQFDQQTMKLSPTAVMCMRKTVCELIYQPPTSLETSTDHSHSGIIHKFSLAGCCTKSEVKGNDHYDQSALWMEVDLDDLHRVSAQGRAPSKHKGARPFGERPLSEGRAPVLMDLMLFSPKI